MVLVIAAAYGVTGKLGLLLAIPPGYATAIWPPSGIALAATLIYGYRVWPGIVLGSVLVNISTALETTSVAVLLQSVALATSIGMGAALQAVVGAYMVHRYVGFPSALTREREIGAFLALGGPLSCLINATISVTTLWLGGKIPWALTPLSWWTWWVGDSIGVFIVTPLTLSWVAAPRQPWRRRRVALTLALVGAFALAVIFFVHTSGQERERLRLIFERQTETVARTLQDRLNDYLGVLYAIESFFTSTPGVTRQEFHTFVQGMFTRHPGLHALSFDRRVPDAQRGAYEEAARRDGYSDFQITEQNAQGQMVRAAQRPEYVAVYYLEPYRGNEQALGFDVASDSDRLEALHRARDMGEPGATDRVMLVQETGQQFGWLTFLPLYGHGLPHATVEERRQYLRGYISGVFRLGDMIEAALRGLNREGLVLRIEDETVPASQRLLYTSQGNTLEGTASGLTAVSGDHSIGMHWDTTVELAGRRWALHFVPTLTYLAARQSLQPWTVLVGGLLFTSLLGAFLLILTGHASIIEQVVVERTAELSQTNAALAREIAERQRAEEAQAHLAAIVESSDDAIISYTLDGAIVSWNAGAEAIFGYTFAEIYGRSIALLRSSDTLNDLRPMLEQIKRGASIAHHDVVRQRQDGVRIDVSLAVSPVRNAAGHVVGGSSIYRDITERKRAEEALRRTSAELARSNADLEQFAYAASHDLQEPLRGVAGCVQLLEQYYGAQLDAQAHQFVAHAVAGVTRMQTLIHDLLTYARVRTHEKPFEPVDCARLLKDVLANLEVAIHENQVCLTHEALPTVMADPTQLLQVFQNLLGNAIKFRSAQPLAIHIGVARCHGTWVFSVRDNGIGIAPQYAERIFVIFQRLHTRDRYPGTGIGLALCKKIVERHGGRIWVESASGRGATFFFTIPILSCA